MSIMCIMCMGVCCIDENIVHAHFDKNKHISLKTIAFGANNLRLRNTLYCKICIADCPFRNVKSVLIFLADSLHLIPDSVLSVAVLNQ